MVSVIIPTYNRSALLKEAVLSVVNQTYRPIECIVVDDGSTDNTDIVIKELQELNDAQFKLIYIKQDNAGAQVARNKGTAAAQGEYIQYLDSDDLLYPEKIKSQVLCLNKNLSYDAVFGDWEKGEIGNTDIINGYASNDMILQLLTKQPIPIFSILFRKRLVDQIGDWDIGIKRNQEIDYHLRGLLLGAVYHYQPGVTGLWRTHTGERIFSKTNFSSAITFYKKWEQQLQEKGFWSSKYQHGFVANYMWFLGDYPLSDKSEMMKLLKEVYRLQPVHPIFSSYKFQLVKFFAGVTVATSLWINQYQKQQKKKHY
jgi:glycosyltransferase involved in cell wall biosynthesis